MKRQKDDMFFHRFSTVIEDFYITKINPLPKNPVLAGFFFDAGQESVLRTAFLAAPDA